MKYISHKALRIIITSVIVALLSHCASRDDEYSQSNPYDPNGDNWKIGIPPTVTTNLGAAPLWYDYDFQRDAGTIICSLHASDKNGKYDTLSVFATIGTSADSMDTVLFKFCQTLDTVFFITGLTTATTYQYRFVAIDTWDSTGVAAGTITTPAGRPPAQVDSIGTIPTSSYISFYWHGKSVNTRYKIYRSHDKNTSPSALLDTTVSDVDAYYYDYVPDCRIYYYVVATVNEFGECRSKKEVAGYKYSTSISYPSSVSASDGSYGACIYVYWSNVYNATRYYIHRSKTYDGFYSIIDSTTRTSYYDTIRDTVLGIYYYYKISAANSKGERSAPSYYNDYGYTGPLSYPSSVTASDGDYTLYIYVSWYNVTGAAGYNVYRSLSSAGVYSLIRKTTSTTFVDSVKTMDYYYYKVAAYDIFGRAGNLSSYNSGYIYQTIYPPGSLTASQGTYDRYISVSWSTVTNAAGYYIYRSKTSILDSFAVIDTISSVSYNDTAPTSDNYYYTVAAIDSLGAASRKSSSAYGYIARLSTPYLSSVSKGSYYTHIRTIWSTVTGATGYAIYRSDSGIAGPFTCIDSTTQAVYDDSSISDENYHHYKVSAYNSLGKTSMLSSADYGYVASFSYPLNIQASQYLYKDRIVLTWGKVPPATGYTIYRAPTSSEAFIKIGSTTDTFFTDTGMNGLTFYYYKVSSLKGATESTLSSYFIGRTLIPPSNFQTTGYSSYIRLGWYSLGSTVGYYIYRSTDEVTFQRIAVLNNGSSSYCNDSVKDYRIYYYKMSAFSAKDESICTYISSAQKPPQIPLNLTATPYPTHVALRWRASAGANSYSVYRGSSTPANIWVGTTNDTTYNDSLTVTTRYYYQVTAQNSAGESGKSNYVYAGILFKPSTPTSFSSVNSPEHISLSWSSSSADQIAGYHLYRADSDTGAFVKIRTRTVTYCYDTVTNGQVYYYKVSAYNDAGESDPTPYITGQRLKPSPPATVSIQSEQFTTHLPVSWSASVGADGYNVYRSLSADTGLAKIKTTVSLFHNDSTVLPETIYYYKISAFNVIGESELSYYVSGKKLSSKFHVDPAISREKQNR